MVPTEINRPEDGSVISSSGAQNEIPRYIYDRIRRPPPPGLCVVRGSTPVVSFGNAQSASVATLGLNPSRIEFVDSKGVLLEGQERRLATHSSLGIADLSHASQEAVLCVLGDCNTYFQRRPYWRWFKPLEQILNACGRSYCDGSACHLDLVQWATDPTWSKLKPAVRKRLIADDAQFLANQLQRNERLWLLLVNGMGAVQALIDSTGTQLEKVESIMGYGRQQTHLFTGRVFNRVQVVGWNTNIQGSFGVSNKLREELSKRVALLARYASEGALQLA